MARQQGRVTRLFEHHRVRDDQRHVRRLFICLMPLLVHAAVRAKQLAVIRGEDHHRVLVERRDAQALVDFVDVAVGLLLQVVVKLTVLFDGRLRHQHLRVDVDVALLGARLGLQALAPGLRARDVGYEAFVERVAERLPGEAEQHNVMRIDEGVDDQPRLLLAPRFLVLGFKRVEQVDRLGHKTGIAVGAGVGLSRAVRFRADPAIKAIIIEAIGAQVKVDDVLNRLAVRRVAFKRVVRARQDNVGMRNMPFAFVKRPVAAGAKVIAHRRHGVRIEPEDVGVERALGRAGRLRDAVQ